MGRFESKQLSQRLCELCNNNVTEDEEHFVVGCLFCRIQRKALFEYIPRKSRRPGCKIDDVKQQTLKDICIYLALILDC